MLVLSRKLGEKIYINENICITVVDIDRGKIRLGIEAPRDVPIFRQELLQEKADPPAPRRLPSRNNADVFFSSPKGHDCDRLSPARCMAREGGRRHAPSFWVAGGGRRGMGSNLFRWLL